MCSKSTSRLGGNAATSISRIVCFFWLAARKHDEDAPAAKKKKFAAPKKVAAKTPPAGFDDSEWKDVRSAHPDWKGARGFSFTSDLVPRHTDGVSLTHSVRSRNKFVSNVLKSRPTSPRFVPAGDPTRYAKIDFGRDYDGTQYDINERDDGWRGDGRHDNRTHL